MRKGIIAEGNWIIDQIKTIDSYPAQEELANIMEEYNSNGGAAFNVLKDLALLEAGFPLEGIGLVGDDAKGDYVLNECERLSINSDQIRKIQHSYTSYTDVMSVQTSGKRTFFHQRGANALLSESHFNFSASSAKIFHLGYLLLLDQLDLVLPDGKTGAAHILRRAKETGLVTSVDLVSNSTGLFKKVVPPALPFVDYLFINEIEAKMLSGENTIDSKGDLIPAGCYRAASVIMDMGIQQWIFLHYQHGVLAMNRDKEILFQPGIFLPGKNIKGTVGAGDALAAGILMGIHEGWSMKKCLEVGVCAAAACLLHPTCSEGIVPMNECLLFPQVFGFRTPPAGSFN